MLKPTFYIPVFGTHGWEKDPSKCWWDKNSALSQFFFKLNLLQLFPDRPFIWSGDLDGVWKIFNGKDWEAGAEALGWMLEHPLGPVPHGARNIIAHSHGGQVALLAAAAGIRIHRLITCGTPYRHEFEKDGTYAAARDKIDRWLHICDSHGDRISILGGIGDSVFGKVVENKWAHENHDVEGISHSKILYEPSYFHLWEEKEWAKFLTE